MASQTGGPARRFRSADLTGGLAAAIVALPLALAFAIASGVPPGVGVVTAVVAGIVAALFGGCPVQITGPTGAMAVILAGGQLGNLLGIRFPAGEHGLLPQLAYLAGQVTAIHWPSLLIGVLTILVMVGWSKWPAGSRFVPGSLMALVLVTATATLAGWPVAVIGELPRMLPAPRLPAFDWASVQLMIQPAMALAALGSIEALLSAVVADGMTLSGHSDPDKELRGQGLGNVVVAFFGGITATGAIARTAVNVRSGGQTRLSGVLHGIFLMLIVSAAAPLAGRIPLAVLAGILLVTSWHMIAWEEIHLIARATRSDFMVMFVTFGTTVAFDLVLAVEVGILLAAGLFIRRAMAVPIQHGQHPDLPPVEVPDDTVVYRIDGPLFFGAAHRFSHTLVELGNVRYVIFRMRAVASIDVTAAISLDDMRGHLAHQGITMILTGLQPQVAGVLARMGVLDRVGRANLYERTDLALAALRQRPPKAA